MRYAKTEAGLEITFFSKQYGVTLKQIAEDCDLNYHSLLQATTGRIAGHEIIPKVKSYIETYKAARQPNRMAVTPIGGAAAGQ